LNVIGKKDKGRCPLCLGEEDAKHIFLNCSETMKWKNKFKIEYEQRGSLQENIKMY
jgi:hypothetical protein